MNSFRDENFYLKEDIKNFSEQAYKIIENLYAEGESLGYNYRDICYILSYLVHSQHRLKLFHEEIEKL